MTNDPVEKILLTNTKAFLNNKLYNMWATFSGA